MSRFINWRRTCRGNCDERGSLHQTHPGEGDRPATRQKLMRIETTPVEALRILDAPALDPITVFLQDFGPGRGRITVECYGEVWTTYWGAMGDKTIRQFVCAVGAYYLYANLIGPGGQRKMDKREQAYVWRIVGAVQEALDLEVVA